MLRKGDLVKWLGATIPVDQTQLGIIGEDQRKGSTSIFVYWLDPSLNPPDKPREPILWLERLRKDNEV
jgi:hypothetical protein